LVIEQRPDPTPGPGQLTLRVRCAGVCGSDLAAGSYLPDGSVLGHELCGEVVAIGAGAPGGWREGELVTAVPSIGCGACGSCLGGDPVHCPRARYVGLQCPGAFAEYVTVGALETIRLPESMDAAMGALIEPVAIGLHQVNASSVGVGSRVAVIGCGPIGLAVVAWCRHGGADVVVASDPVGFRRELAAICGADRVVDPTSDDLVAVCREAMGGVLPDVVFDCAGSRLGDAIRLVRVGGRVIEAAYAAEPVPIDVPRALLKEATLVFPSWYQTHEFHTTIGAIVADRLPVKAMVTHRIALDDLPSAYTALRQPTDQGKVLVTL
jgi:(R,R)-butanediol dehydrogenase / meso-butanediol dehydrogenase / diacetyl reductase